MNRKILSAFLTAVVLLGSFSSISLPASGAGNFIITNPYADVNWTTFRQYKAALHTHSTHSNESGMTAAVNGLDVMSERHYSLGFHVVAVTDHSRTTVSPDVVPANISADAIRTPLSTARMNAMAQGAGRGGAEGMIFIPNSNERSHTLPAITTDNHHVGAYFVDSTRSGSMSAFLSDFDTRNGYAVLNHPSRYVGAAWSDTTNKTTVRTIFNRESVWRPYADLYLNHSSLKGLEIVNEFDYDSQGTRILWDNILRQTAPAGKLVWGFANDDAHHVPTIGYTYNLLLMPSLSLDYVRTSMDSGAFLAFGRVDRSRDIYPVATMREQSNNRRDDSAIRRALDMPVPAITSISVGVDTVTVNARVSGANSTYPENASNMTIQWIADGEVIFTGATLNLNTHGARIGSYVRAEVVHTNYGVLYTQPFGVRRSGEDFSIYDLQRAVSTADTAILVNAGSGTRAVDLSANPKRVSVSSRAAASDGLDIDISRLQTRAGHSYTFEVTGTLGASAGVGVRFVFRRANNGGNIVAPAVTGAGGAFSFSYTVSHETIRAQLTANADERYRVRSESDLGNIVITGLVIKEISGDGTTPATPASTSAAPPTVPTVPTTSTVPTTASTISGEPTTASTISGEPTTASTISGEPTTVTTGATFQPTTALTPPTGSEPPIINITPIVRRTVTEICVVCSVEKAWRVVTLYENDIVITQHKAVTKRDAQGNLRGGCLQAS